ncbi:hypothetical protein EIP91_009783 [Steccherinum ochraceum]|uniref:DUF6535 domain-containing protein n=1 Tax=Steccherinum ochraceum TaxID=92696 RepID=A0A4R0RJG2_9APHY|nr:hypothetical protein EIP91_009783 [Steccherinum ochraceum]
MDDSSPGKDSAKLSRDEVLAVVKDILATLEKSSIVPQGVPDKILRFWTRYKEEATEYDTEFLHKYREDMDTSMIFAGLFSAVTATVASMTIPDLSPNPADTTNALLQNIWMSVNHTSGAAPSAAPLPTWNGPPASVVWVQCLLYTSLACSLFAALGAVLGKQWLNRYNSVDEHGSLEERCRTRHRKFTAMEEWHFRRVLEALPVLLQLSLLLFGLALSAFMFTRQLAVAIVLTFANLVGAGFYFTVVIQSVRFDDSPFQTSLSDLLRRTLIYGARSCMGVADHWQKSSARRYALAWGTKFRSSCARCGKAIMGAMMRMARPLAVSALFFANSVRCMGHAISPLVFGPRTAMNGAVPSDRDPEDALTHNLSSTNADEITQSSASHPDFSLGTIRGALKSGFTSLMRLLSNKSTRHSDAGLRVRAGHERGADESRDTAIALLWLLDATTDVMVRADAMQVVPLVEWPMDLRMRLCTTDRLDFLLQQVVASFPKGADGKAYLPGTHEQRTTGLCAAFLFLYWELRILDWKRWAKWGSSSGTYFAKDHTDIMEALSRYMNMEHESATILYFTSLTLRVDLPLSSRSTSYQWLSRWSSTTIGIQALCTRTLLYLAQSSIHPSQVIRYKLPPRYSVPLGAIARHCMLETSEETSAASLIATAVLCCPVEGPDHPNGMMDYGRAAFEPFHIFVCMDGLLNWMVAAPMTPDTFVSLETIISGTSNIVCVLENAVGALRVLHNTRVADKLLSVCQAIFSVWSHRDDFDSVVHLLLRLLKIVVSSSSTSVALEIGKVAYGPLEMSSFSNTELTELRSKGWQAKWQPRGQSRGSQLPATWKADRNLHAEWLPWGSHTEWLLEFLALLHHGPAQQQDDELMLRGTLNVLHILGRIHRTDLIDDDRLTVALSWATARSTTRSSEGDGRIVESSEVTRVLLQVVTLALLDSLTVAALPEGSSRLITAAQQSQHVCSTVLYPDKPLVGTVMSKHSFQETMGISPTVTCIIFERDKRFLSLVYHFSSVDRVDWLNDMRNDAYVRSWTAIEFVDRRRKLGGLASVMLFKLVYTLYPLRGREPTQGSTSLNTAVTCQLGLQTSLQHLFGNTHPDWS